MVNKRMAVKAERLKKSKKYPKYWKYSLDIEEIDGTIHTTPAYGIDLENALTSVDLIAKRSWMMRFFNKVPQWVAFVVVGTLMTSAAVLSEIFQTPSWIVGLLGAVGIIGGALYFINNSIEKHMVNRNE